MENNSKPSDFNAEEVSEKEYKPYISPHKNIREFTIRSAITGCILAILLGAANAYLALKIGMTICASIPAAVIGMAVLKSFKNGTVLENNMIQTIGSAGEALAAGVAFTVPALLILKINVHAVDIFVIAATGGLLGCILVIPLRKKLIKEDHNKLPYPEGTACAEVIIAGQEGGEMSRILLKGLGIGAVFKFFTNALRLFPEELDIPLKGFLKGGAAGADFYPSLLGAGFLVGPRIAGITLAGSIIGWFAILPVIFMIGQYVPEAIGIANIPIAKMDHWDIWTYYLKYIGIGAVVMGGLISLFRAVPIITKSVKGIFISNKGKDLDILRTERNIPSRQIMGLLIILLGVIAFIPVFPSVIAGSLGAVFVLFFGFIFVAVSAHLVGYIGSSNNPIVAMTVGALLVTAILFRFLGFNGTSGVVTVVVIGSVICICIGVSGDMMQDLKTGFLLGATPSSQQYGQMIGILCASAGMGTVIIMLDKVYTIGGKHLPAPQANMIKSLAEGVMSGNLPWTLILAGMGIALAVWLLGGEVLPFSVGLYLPVHLSITMMIGGIIRAVVDHMHFEDDVRAKKIEKGTILSSGYIAGDALMGVIATALIYCGRGIDHWTFLDPVRTENPWISAGFFCIIVAYFCFQVFHRKGEDKLSGREINL